MDSPFEAASWTPTRPWEAGETPYSQEQITTLIKQLNQDTKNIYQYPYDPSFWTRRAKTLSSLRYPEMAVGDGQKAYILSARLLNVLERPRWRVGYRRGFCMLDEEIDEEELEKEKDRQEISFARLQSKASKVISKNLYYWPEAEKGKFHPTLYPWVQEKHQIRTDELLDTLNREFADPANRGTDEKACIVQRYAFGHGVGARDGADLLGVFATRDIRRGETILIDKSRTWVCPCYFPHAIHPYKRADNNLEGCNGPGKNGNLSNLFGGSGCPEPLHPNSPSDDVSKDMRWIRDRAGRRAADTILKCRFMLCCIQDNIQHPLDHPLLARLTPTYRGDKTRTFHLETDISILNAALQKFGIDIFANPNFDTWTFFILMSRLDNNSWSDPNTSCLNAMFAMFNHSCEPNVRWSTQDDHRTLHVRTIRDIEAGEQLFVEYDSFMADEPIAKRRDRLRRWLNGPCQCTRCVREEAEMRENGEDVEFDPTASFSSDTTSGTGSSWDMDEKPIFPEDSEGERWDSVGDGWAD